MATDPLISVLLPCYKQSRYLSQAIESVLAQKDANWELLISDDASPDNTAEIARHYESLDPRIRVHVQPTNLGMAANWNWCLQQARGSHIKYLFGDDYFCDDHALRILSDCLTANPRTVLATSARLIVDADSRKRKIVDHVGADRVQPGQAAILNCLLTNKNLIGEPSAVMFRRDVANRGYDASYLQLIDLEFWAHMLEQGDLAYVSRPLCAFRRHDEQQTAVNNRTKAAEDEGLRMYIHYRPLIQNYLKNGGSRHIVRQALFRNIYFVRKNKNRSAQTHALENKLLHELTPRWYLVYRVHHLLTKPLLNLRNALRIPPPAVPL